MAMLSAFAASGLVAGAVADEMTLQGKVATALTLDLEGNPSTGYTWEYQVAPASADLVSVEACEWREKAGTDTKLMGRSKVFHCRIMPLAKGTAEITFTYSRPWESKPPAKTLTCRITIK
ncbi:MAG: protease inhibitor I42 family protein [Rhodobiaceae bacterium]|nr:protease inhibitor I42 family protein [Rhodobiaceae bacterium]MCC0053979.1 protease inhibitor I42 family protein [Rhodobiaceae bacterium]